jgi:hypothetical protein
MEGLLVEGTNTEDSRANPSLRLYWVGNGLFGMLCGLARYVAMPWFSAEKELQPDCLCDIIIQRNEGKGNAAGAHAPGGEPHRAFSLRTLAEQQRGRVV